MERREERTPGCGILRIIFLSDSGEASPDDGGPETYRRVFPGEEHRISGAWV